MKKELIEKYGLGQNDDTLSFAEMTAFGRLLVEAGMVSSDHMADVLRSHLDELAQDEPFIQAHPDTVIRLKQQRRVSLHRAA